MSTTVLVIGYVWPEPNSSAAGSHMLSILRLYKRQGWQVEFATPAQPTEHMIDLATEGITSKSITLNCDSFDTYVADLAPDIVMFDRFMMEEQFGWRVEKHCPKALKILDTEDLQCLRQARHQALKANRALSRADLFSDIAKREIAAILRCDLSLIISDFEMQLLQDTFKVDASLLQHLPFMVELSALPAQTLGFLQRQHFMTIGNFRHAPNWDAVLYLQQIWPLIRQQLPQAELHIYGSYPPPKATALHNPKTGFLIKGWADDAFVVMEQARICLAPLRFGAGIKGKLLDAMIMQTPSVTTAIGSEGMHGEQPWPGAVVEVGVSVEVDVNAEVGMGAEETESAEEAQQFADAAVNLYQDEARWQQAQQAGTALLTQRYDGEQLGAQLISRIMQLASQLDEHRLANFTGSMLRHHSMMSTKYMSQWIAAKNAAPADNQPKVNDSQA